MTITTKAFDVGMQLLADNYDRLLPKSIQAIWFQYLDEHLNDDEFMAAIKHLILHSRFMPTASELVEYIQGSKEVKALQEWQLIVQSSGRPDPDLSYLSDRGRIALKAIAGIRTVARASSDTRSGMSEVQRLEKKFVAVYLQCSAQDRRTLSQSESLVSEVSVVEEGVKEPSPAPEGWFEDQKRILASRMAMVKVEEPELPF